MENLQAKIAKLEAENAQLCKENHELMVRWHSERVLHLEAREREIAIQTGRAIQRSLCATGEQPCVEVSDGQA